MTATTTPRNRGAMLAVISVIAPLAFPVKANEVIPQGTLMCVDGSGRAVNGTAALGLTPVGRAERTYDNTGGADGAVIAEARPGVYGWDNSPAGGDAIAAANASAVCYIADNQTVALTDGGGTRSKAGVIVGIGDDGSVLVSTGFFFLATPAATPSGTMQKRTLVLDDTITGAADTNGTASAPINVGAALPASAVIVGVELVVAIEASGGAVATAELDVGFAGETQALIKQIDLVATAPGTYDGTKASGSAPSSALPLVASGKQVQAIVTPDVGHKLSALTALGATINVYYFVAF